MNASSVPPRRVGRSVLAIVAGFFAVVVLSLATDQLFHVLEVYPPWGRPMNDTGLLSLALCYRMVYGALGSWLAARLAPGRPMFHALLLGFIGLVPATIGVLVTIRSGNLGPVWYPVALAITTLPCAWLGGKLGPR